MREDFPMRHSVLAIAGALMVAAPAAAATYGLDAGHTEVRFYWDHAGVSEQSGEWGDVSGTVEFDPENIEATSISVTIKAASISTGFGPLDDHLRSGDFFEVEAHPEITFVSTGAVKTGPESVRLTGDLTIKETTKPVTLDVTLTHMGPHPVGQFLPEYYGGEWLGVRATGTLIRSEFGVGFGAPLTSDHILLDISTELKAQ
jgi:polyisoprenoid-binding protein YceI